MPAPILDMNLLNGGTTISLYAVWIKSWYFISSIFFIADTKKVIGLARSIIDRYKVHSSMCPAMAIDELLAQGNIMDENTDTIFQLLDELIVHERELRKIRQRLEAVLQAHKMNQLCTGETEANRMVTQRQGTIRG